jgi:hypothetical protein
MGSASDGVGVQWLTVFVHISFPHGHVLPPFRTRGTFLATLPRAAWRFSLIASRWNRTMFVTCFRCKRDHEHLGWTRRDRELFKWPVIICHLSSEGKTARTLIGQSGIYPRNIKPVAEDVRQRAEHQRNQRSLIDTSLSTMETVVSPTLWTLVKDWNAAISKSLNHHNGCNHLKTGSYNSWLFKANDRLKNTLI